jgi:hypothetical protein
MLVVVGVVMKTDQELLPQVVWVVAALVRVLLLRGPGLQTRVVAVAGSLPIAIPMALVALAL